MDKGVVAKLPKDLLESAYPELATADPPLKSRYVQTLLEAANALFQQPTPYNSLRDKHLKGYFERPQVKDFLKSSGLVADGCCAATRDEEKLADKARRLLAEREAILNKLQQKERDCLERLWRLTTPGPLKSESRTDSFMDLQLKSIQETKRKLVLLRAQGHSAQSAGTHSKTGIDYGAVLQAPSESSTIYSQQSSNVSSQQLSNVTSQQLSNISRKKTYVKSAASATSTVESEPRGAQPQLSDVRADTYPPPVTTRDCGMQITPDPSMIEVRAKMLLAIEDENEQLKQAYYEQLLRQEEESLKIRLQYEKKRQEKNEQRLQQLELMQAQREVEEQKMLEQEKMRLHHEIKRRIALETIVNALEEEERKATMTAKIQLEKQRRLEEERKRQMALLKAKQRTAEKKRERFCEYEGELLMSPGTSPKLPKLPASPVQITQAAAERSRDVTVQMGRAVPSQKSIASTKTSGVTKYTLPGQVHVTESDKASDHESETGAVLSDTQQLKVDKETNTSMCLLQGLAHLIPAASHTVDHNIVMETHQDLEPTTSAQPELSHMMSTASQTGLSMADVATFTGEPEDQQGGSDVGESGDVNEEDYLEAVEEVQVAISQELLESAIRMSPQISEAIVERVSSLGPEAMEVLEEIRSKLSVHSLPSSSLWSREASDSALSIDATRSPTPYPNASTLSIAQATSSASSFSSAIPSGKAVPSRQSIGPSLQSIAEGTLTDQNESVCVLVPPQEVIQEETAESRSVSTVGSSTNQPCLSLQSTRVVEDTAKAFIDQIFCDIVQNPMYQDLLSGDSSRAQTLPELMENADITEELESVWRKCISVPSSSINLHDTTSPSGSAESLQTTMSEVRSYKSGSSSKASSQRISAFSSRPLSELTDHSSSASTKKTSPAPSSRTAITQADKKASASSVQSNQSVKGRQPSRGTVSPASSRSSSTTASKASIVSQKGSSKGVTSRVAMSQASSAASKLSVGASRKSMQGGSSQQGGPAPVTKSEVAMGTSTKDVQMSASQQQSGGIEGPVSSQSSMKSGSTRRDSSKQSNMPSVGGELPEWDSQLSNSGMSRRPSEHACSVKMEEYHQSPVQSSQTLPLTPEPTDQAMPPHSLDDLSKTLSSENVVVPQPPKGSIASLSAGESAAGAEGSENVMEPNSSGVDIEEANQLVVTCETPEEELKNDDDTPNGDLEKDSSINSMASSGSLPKAVFAREASTEAMERAPSRHADAATTSPLPVLQNAEERDQPELFATEDNNTGMAATEERVVTTFEDQDALLVPDEEVQPSENSVLGLSKQADADAAGNEDTGSDKQIGGGQKSNNSLSTYEEHPATILATSTDNSSSLAGEELTQSPSEHASVGKPSSKQPSSASVGVGSKASVASVGKPSSKQPSSASVGVGSKASVASVGKPSSKQPSSASVGVGSKASAASVGKSSSKQPSSPSVGVGSKASVASVGKPSSKQPSSASVGVGSKASAASVGKSSSKQPSSPSVGVGSKASTASVGKTSSKQPSSASVGAEPSTSVASVGKSSSKQPSSASVGVGSKASVASFGKPSPKQPSSTSVGVGSKASVASVGKPSSKQPSSASVGAEPSTSVASVGKSSSKQPSSASVGVGSKASTASVGKTSSKQPSSASVGAEPSTSVASIGKSSFKQPSSASVGVGSKASVASFGKPSSKQPSSASVGAEPSASVASIGKSSSKQPSSASVGVGSKASVASFGKPSSKQPSSASVGAEPSASVASVGKPSSKQPSSASVATDRDVESSSGVVQPAGAIDSSEVAVTGTEEAAPEEDNRALPTGESCGESAGGVDEVQTEKPSVMSAEGGSLMVISEGVPPGDDKDNAAIAVSQTVGDASAVENVIVTAPTPDQTSAPCVQTSDKPLDKDSVETVDSKKTVVKQPSCSSVSQGEALSSEVADDTAASGETSEVPPLEVVDADDGRDEASTPVSETVNNSALPPTVDDSNKAGLHKSETPMDAVKAQQLALDDTQVSKEEK